MVKKVVTAKEGTALQKAIEILHKKHIGSVVILDDEKKCAGIFTERDASGSLLKRFLQPLH